MRKKEEIKGFSLLELLATIFVVSIVLGITGYFVMNTINSSKEEGMELAINNIKNVADIYTKEYSNEIPWDDDKACISIEELINKGYLKKEEIDKNIDDKYIILTRDANSKIIISNELDKNGSCAKKVIPIPTTNKYCSNISYNGSNQNLININQITNSEQLTFQDNEQINAGNYKIKINLKDGNGYVWSDGSKDEKYITCTIKKAIPELKLNKTGENGQSLENTNITIFSNIKGTLKVKSSNKEYATTSITDFNDVKNEQGYYQSSATIKKLSKKEANTYITFTLNPTDKNNYYSKTVVYTIGNVTKKTISVPECNNLYYNAKEQILIKDGEGYTLWNEKAVNEGKYSVTIQLKYGYTWSDQTTNNKTKTCEMKKAMPYVTYITNGGGACTPEKKQVTYNFAYGALCSTSKTGYKFNGWYTESSGGSLVDSNTIVNNFNDHNLYANWTPRPYTLNYKNNGGSGCDKKTVTYASDYGDLCTPTKTGYNFAGWYTKSSGGSEVTTTTKVSTAKDHNIYARWTAKTITITYDENGGKACSPKTKKVTYDSTYGDTPCTPEKTGYDFAGWYTEKSGGSQVFTTTKVSTAKDHDIYAQWTAKTITITYNDNGGSGCGSQNKKVTYNSTYGTLCTPTKPGYKFDGWYTTSSGGNQIVNSSIVNITNDQQLHAHWHRTDNTAPSCGIVQVYENGKWKDSTDPSWTNKDRKLRVKCTDNDSGCTQDYYEQTFTTTAENGKITITDKSGLTTVCNVTVKIDKEHPQISYKKKSGWIEVPMKYGKKKKVTMYINDTGGSGITGKREGQPWPKAKVYVTNANGKVHCQNKNKWEFGNICENMGYGEIKETSKKFWRAYRVEDHAGNASIILCTYEETNETEVATETGDYESCTVKKHTFKK